MNLTDTALSLLVLSMLSAGCGSRSGLDCFGDTCQVGGSSSVGFAGGGGAGGEDDPPPPVIIPPREPPGDSPSDQPSASRCGPSSTFVGSLEVNDESGLELLAGCVMVDGDLQINLFGTDLSALGELEAVTGTLGLSFTGSLDGLENLDQVGNLSLVRLDVPSLRPLANLRTIGGNRRGRGDLTIQGLQRQRDLDGLGGIRQLRRLMISEGGSLESLDGLAVPSDLDLVSVTGSPAIVDISALTPLQIVGDLTLEGLGITTLTGLHNLVQASTVSLINLQALSHIRALQNLPEVRTIEVREVAVRQLDGLEGLRSATNIIITSNPNLTNIGALASLERLSQLLINENPELDSVPDIPAVDRLQRVEIERNPLLPHVPFFPGVTELEFLRVIDNASLLSVRGFSGLQRARSIDIRQNPTLEELPFPALTRAGELTIHCNAALLESSIEPLRAVSDSASFSGNLGSSAPCTDTLQ